MLVFPHIAKLQDAGGQQPPGGTVTFRVYFNRKELAEVVEWLDTTCLGNYRFSEAKVWRYSKCGANSKRYQDRVPVLYIFDRGVAALFKMTFSQSLAQQRDYRRQQLKQRGSRK